MKIRTDFVTNSSSSSFITVRASGKKLNEILSRYQDLFEDNEYMSADEEQGLEVNPMGTDDEFDPGVQYPQTKQEIAPQLAALIAETLLWSDDEDAEDQTVKLAEELSANSQAINDSMTELAWKCVSTNWGEFLQSEESDDDFVQHCSGVKLINGQLHYRLDDNEQIVTVRIMDSDDVLECGNQYMADDDYLEKGDTVLLCDGRRGTVTQINDTYAKKQFSDYPLIKRKLDPDVQTYAIQTLDVEGRPQRFFTTADDIKAGDTVFDERALVISVEQVIDPGETLVNKKSLRHRTDRKKLRLLLVKLRSLTDGSALQRITCSTSINTGHVILLDQCKTPLDQERNVCPCVIEEVQEIGTDDMRTSFSRFAPVRGESSRNNSLTLAQVWNTYTKQFHEYYTTDSNVHIGEVVLSPGAWNRFIAYITNLKRISGGISQLLPARPLLQAQESPQQIQAAVLKTQDGGTLYSPVFNEALNSGERVIVQNGQVKMNATVDLCLSVPLQHLKQLTDTLVPIIGKGSMNEKILVAEVVYEQGGKHYSYFFDDLTLKPGDVIKTGFGKILTIESVEIIPRNELTLPENKHRDVVQKKVHMVKFRFTQKGHTYMCACSDQTLLPGDQILIRSGKAVKKAEVINLERDFSAPDGGREYLGRAE